MIKRKPIINPHEVPHLLLGGFGIDKHSMYHPGQFTYDPEGQYLYVADRGDTRRLVLFHATDQDNQYLSLESREARLALSWRKNARGPGLYGGNTPYAAASSLVVSKDVPPRTMQAFITEALTESDIRDKRQDPSYYGPMVRAQFSNTYGAQMVQNRAAQDGTDRVHIISPGLVSCAKTDGYVTGPLVDHEIVPSAWLRVIAEPESNGPRSLERIGVLQDGESMVTVERSIVHTAQFLGAALARVAAGASQRY